MISKWINFDRFSWKMIFKSVLDYKIISSVILFGVLLRILFWATLFPIWKHFGTFLVFKLPIVQYLGNFQGYKPSRAPFYDLFSAILYIPTDSIFGVRAVTVFSLLVSVLAVPAMFIAARRLFNHEVAVLATIFYALYPKMLVLTGQGFPEAAATSLVVLSLVALVDNSGSLRGSISAGVGVTLAYLTFIPAVIFGIYTSLYLIIQRSLLNRIDSGDINKNIQRTICYNAIPFAVGMLYLIFGPVQELFKSVSAQSGTGTESLFINASEYEIAEKIVRYIGYHFFDFWWHMRGFDKESHILSTIQRTSEFLGHWSTLFFSGWGIITILLTIPIIVGFVRMIQHHTEASIYVVGIFICYLAIDTYRNIGWIGGFQIRHIFIIFPFVCLFFGVGVSHTQKITSDKYPEIQSSIMDLLPSISSQSAFQLAAIVAFVVLITVTFVNVQYGAQNNQEAIVEPTGRLVSETTARDQVAVTSQGDYQRTVLFSESKIMPNIWVKNKLQESSASSRTVVADTRIVSPSNVSNASEDYLFITEQCGSFSKREHRLIGAAIETGGKIVFNQTNERRNRCSIQNALIEL